MVVPFQTLAGMLETQLVKVAASDLLRESAVVSIARVRGDSSNKQ